MQFLSPMMQNIKFKGISNIDLKGINNYFNSLLLLHYTMYDSENKNFVLPKIFWGIRPKQFKKLK